MIIQSIAVAFTIYVFFIIFSVCFQLYKKEGKYYQILSNLPDPYFKLVKFCFFMMPVFILIAIFRDKG